MAGLDVCDKCGGKFKQYSTYSLEIETPLGLNPFRSLIGKQYNLCKDCHKIFKKWITK